MRGIILFVSRFLRDERGTMVASIAKAAVAIAFLSVIAANIMSNRIEAHEKSIMAAISGFTASGRSVDANSTGSLARDANGVKIDPCVLPPRR